MSIDDRFLVAIAIMSGVAFACRVVGLIIGTFLGDSQVLRRLFDVLPTCAIGAVLGPSLGMVTLLQGAALVLAAAIYLLSSRFLLALAAGALVLLSDQAGSLPSLF